MELMGMELMRQCVKRVEKPGRHLYDKGLQRALAKVYKELRRRRPQIMRSIPQYNKRKNGPGIQVARVLTKIGLDVSKLI